jgi:hypothetical protein
MSTEDANSQLSERSCVESLDPPELGLARELLPYTSALRLLSSLSVFVCALLLGGACGPASGSGDGGKGGGATGGTDGEGTGGTGPSASCPATLPTFNTSCPALGLTCTYGESPRPSCRSIMSCGGAEECNCGSDLCPPADCTTPQTWAGGGPGSGVGYTDRCAWTCPATAPSVGEPCTPPGYCAESDGSQCGCIAFDVQGTSVWACLPPPSDPRCPGVAPLIGSACSNDGLACGNYDICVTGSRVLCKSGTWVDNFGSCPN